MKAFSSVDLYFFIKENKEKILNSRVETFYIDGELFTTRIYVKGEGNKFLTIALGSYIYLSDKKYNAPFHPTSFVSYMRKYLKNSFIDSIEQIGLERVIKITLSKKEGEEIKTYNLYLELFSGGNIVICDGEDIIQNSLIKKTYKDRNVRNKQHYELPPSRGVKPLESGVKELKEVIETSELSVVKFLALECGLGGKYAEEICRREGIDKNTSVVKIGYETTYYLLQSLFSLSLEPCLVKNNSSISDFFPFKPTNNTQNIEQKDSFNQCLIEYYTQFDSKQNDQKDDEIAKKIKKLEKRIRKQEEQKLQVLHDSEEYQLKGEKIYEHYAEIEELLEGISRAAKEKGWDHVFKVIEENERLKQFVDKLDYKNNKIIVNLDDK